MMKKLTELKEWKNLKAHHQAIASKSMLKQFAEDPKRFERFSLEASDLFLDYSKNRITAETLSLLCKLAQAVSLPEKINDLFSGQLLNVTEKKAVLHTALRHSIDSPILLNGKNIIPTVHAVWDKMRNFIEKVHGKKWLGATGKPIYQIVNIGIGGCYLGPMMITEGLKDFAVDNIECYFISHIDSVHIKSVLEKINPETTLFIISSKSFTTLETLTNAKTIRAWLQNKMPVKDITPHFIAITSEPDKVQDFDIPEEQIFPLWEWVGGRFSVWSAIGLPVALTIGMDKFLEFLQGGYAMDMHFQQAPMAENMPVILALLGIWYINFFNANTQAFIPYAQELNYFRAHLQQLDMESNGKATLLTGEACPYATGPIIWGEQGCIGQHAFHQLLHQSNHFVPVDFVLIGERNNNDFKNSQDILIASGLSQAEALMRGKTLEQAYSELLAIGYSEKEAKNLAPHKTIPGNRPSNVLFLKKVTPFTLGALLALYEHKVFVQGVIWNINSFDQWGVELGKQLLPAILNNLRDAENSSSYDSSTRGLIEYYKKLRDKE